ncbi:MAG TPA: hypothetical protein VGO80_03640 [Solirubrobacteraceae bacterium]|jgi:hypothetical protein|nr:hypothetical protein [Solirubrobacteraceae bacterium]
MTDSGHLTLRLRADGGLIYLAATYNDALKALIKTLPHRRWDRDLHEWVVPARADDRRALLRVIALAEELGVVVDVDNTARPRLDKLGITRIRRVRGDIEAVELISPYDEDRAALHRGLPERRFDATRKAWLVPMTRTGAQAVLKLITDEPDSYVATDAALSLLTRTADASSAVAERRADGDGESGRQSPIPHTRKITRGPIFNARPHDRVLQDGVLIDGVRHDGVWCVLVRVDPARNRRKRTPAVPVSPEVS